MPAKLTVELDAKTDKARQKIREAIEGASSPSGDGQAASGDGQAALSQPALGLSKTFSKLDQSAGEFDRRLVTRAFAGLAVGMATSYAARYFDEGSTGRKAMEYGGAAISAASSGAAAGAALGPGGAVAGALTGGVIGLLKTYFDKEGERSEKLEDFEKSEKIYDGVKKWEARFKELAENKDLDAINADLARFREREQEFIQGTRDAIENGEYEKAEDYQRNLNWVRGRQDMLTGLKDKLDKEGDPKAGRASFSAVDSISRIGDNFGGGDVGRETLNTAKDQLSVLRRIEEKTGSQGGSTWQ